MEKGHLSESAMETEDIRNLLSEREYEIMVLVSSGKLNKEIANDFHCKLCTVKKHLQHIFPKLEVQNRTEATIKFLKLSGKLNQVSEN